MATKNYIVYQLGYDSESDQEYLIVTGLFVTAWDTPEMITALADLHWGKDWWGLAYQEWSCNDLNVESRRIFNHKEAAE